ncbi:hypothetical protein JZ751_001733 [Albula glossodonta]|uniref:BZIP domain-containing protein n=1 Tax=Albula glossodonta TaxID=121402 RepID=A0A8T2PUH7_9TELE|nr:hypothetical protein JZ751_001733 [Albula glossodonta]
MKYIMRFCIRPIKKEPSSSSSCSGDDALVLPGTLQGSDTDGIRQKLSNAAFKGRNSSCRRKREFIPDEKKDELYWERRRKNNEAAKRSREKRRINDMVLENKLIRLGEENASLKAELLSLKLRFGLVSSTAYAQEVQKISSASAVLYKDLASPGAGHVSVFRDSESGSSCISVIKHSPHIAHFDVPKTSTMTQDGALRASEVVKQELIEGGGYTRDIREGSGPYEVYSNYNVGSFSGTSSQASPPLPIIRSPSNSPRTLDGDEGAASKSSDGEDEQRVPKGPVPSPLDPKSISPSTVNVPEASSSALPHKLRIKARAVQIKVEAIDPDYDTQDKGHANMDLSVKGCYTPSQRVESDLMKSSLSPLSVQVANFQGWAHQPGHWQADHPETLQNNHKSRIYPSSPDRLTDKLIVDLKEGPLTNAESENLYLKQGIAKLSAEVASLKRLITNRQVSVVELGKSTPDHALLSKGCYAE